MAILLIVTGVIVVVMAVIVVDMEVSVVHVCRICGIGASI